MTEASGWETWREERLAWLADGLRRDLWRRVKLERPLAPNEVMAWVGKRARGQRPGGDRLRLYLPAGPARHERRALLEPLRAQARTQDAPDADSRMPWIRETAGRFYVDVFAGEYLSDDFGDLAARTWPQTSHAARLPHLALLALAAREVHRVTGASLEAALLFLLCDVPCGQSFVMSFSTDSGLRFWAYDPFLPAEKLSSAYVAFRRDYVPRNRPKRPERHTLELIRLVQEMRPQAGRSPENASWAKVRERWNAEHPRNREYVNVASMSRAYTQALARRKELGQL